MDNGSISTIDLMTEVFSCCPKAFQWLPEQIGVS